jgi:Na+-translocating ferredoxin:NAD+ oxidoreductase RnfC subunit
MSEIQTKMIERAKELLESGEVSRVVGWKKGEFFHDPSPASFETVESLKDFVYNDFCGANLSKYMIQICKKEGKTAIFLKPCDSYSFNQLIKEYRVKRENVLVIAISCNGKLDNNKLMINGVDGVLEESYNGDKVNLKTLDGDKILDKKDVLLDKCLSCKTKVHALKDEEIIIDQVDTTVIDRFSLVKQLEEMTADERFKFWQNELSKCIRCNACRNVCPACSCVKCVFDNNNSGISAKANDTEFEEKLYHIIRAFHVSGRCTDCGECSRVCPQNIPLHLLNRKFIKDINVLYGEYQAGAEAEGRTPLTSFTTEDVEPNDAITEAKK